MPEIVQRDPEQTADTLAKWLSTRLAEGADPVISDVQAPASSGFSNETILCHAAWNEDGQRSDRQLVFRVHPTKHLLFLDADFSLQYKVMKTLADAKCGIPLPSLRWYEEDPSWLGVPFFLMDHVAGIVPGEPTYNNDWLMNATPVEQERMWTSGLEAMAKVHRTDWRALELDWLARPSQGKPGLDEQLGYYRSFLDWTAKGRPQPVAEATWQWLMRHRPNELGDVALCWGDSRMGNIIWEDFSPRAVIDWEMATLAQPELDLGWWLYFDRQFSVGLPDPQPRPAGFPSREATIEHYSSLIGREMGDVFYYEVFSGFRFAVIMCRLTDLLLDSGILPMDSDMGTNNLATQLLSQMLEL